MELLDSILKIDNAFLKKINRLNEELAYDFYKQYLSENKNIHGFPTLIKLGNIVSSNHTFPCLLNTTKMNGIAFQLNETNRIEVNLTMEHIALQVVEQLKEEYCEITIIDPLNLGSNFRNLRRLHKNILKNKVFEQEDIEECIDKNYQDSVAVINECLLHYKNIEEYNTKSGHKQALRILLIADFPHYFRNSMNKLNTILMNARDAGVLVLMSVNNEIENEYFKNEFDNIMDQLVVLDEFNENDDLYKITNIDNSKFYNDQFTIKLDRRDINPDNLSTKVLNINKAYAVKENTDSSEGGLRIPIGKASGVTFYLTLGHGSGSFHAIIGGQSGKGKTVLLNNIIAKGIEAYDEKELAYAIIDCSGVGFYNFKGSNRITHFESSGSQKICADMVVKLDEELKRRESLFRDSRVDDIDKFNLEQKEELPRIIIVIDEFHVLFSDEDYKSQEIANVVLVDRIIRIGRKFGMHLILSSQSLDGIPTNILNNIPLRIALGMTQDESYNFLEPRNNAAENLAAGVAIYNSKNGDKNDNKIVKVYHIQEEEIERIVNL
tara:strand:- start:7252 stop:8901 length:1650 start_codon:yes stop_codon:yes gene_type:complete